ncbi:adenosylcobinamide-GDP ribazoletransferase [Nocardiopsis kunsanensis]|uniref:Adenosylcobinamide-GDP ribazoletransferase n=1 Tax=Nocardiopsis kunsanensis TaxID=141693 RepID=A0A918XET2_9ACTN|nr:adenosylcobinamide-GDP ribazoletransferase [Nocardiopsis kunsanensis]GHD27399.1 adenosylcobinamide-GDP ribazoletransferase [Nocardiopsis kunsanensis]
MSPATGRLADVVDGARMATGTFTAVPVRAGRLDRAVAGWAMAWAPWLGVLLGLAVGLVAVSGSWLGLAPTLAALLGVALGALATRALHLDGLADVADGLGSARRAEGALEVMRRSDIGPFGVVALIVTLGVRTLALGQLVALSPATALSGAVLAGAVSRTAATWACLPVVPSAREEGLGAFVAGSVRGPGLALASVALVLAWATGWFLTWPWVLGGVLATVAGLAVAGLLLRHCVRRLGGITGDVLGSLAESSGTTALVVLAASAAWV